MSIMIFSLRNSRNTAPGTFLYVRPHVLYASYSERERRTTNSELHQHTAHSTNRKYSLSLVVLSIEQQRLVFILTNNTNRTSLSYFHSFKINKSKHCMGIDMELTALNISSGYTDNRRPFSHISRSEDTTTTGSLRRRKEAKCSSDPRLTHRSDHSFRSAGQTCRRPKSVHGSMTPFLKRRSYAKSSQNASFLSNTDKADGMDLIHAMRLKRFGGLRDFAAECNLNLEALSIHSPLKTKKNIFFHIKERRPTGVIPPLHANSPSSTDGNVNPVWKGILDTRDIFKLDSPPCEQVEISHDADHGMNRSDSCVTIDSMLAE